MAKEVPYTATAYNPWAKDFPDFLRKARSDPKWLMTCMQDERLNPSENVSFALFIYTIRLECHDGNNHEWKTPEMLLKWLQDMEAVGHPVCYNDIKHCVDWPNFENTIFFGWKLWYRWLRTGEYVSPRKACPCQIICGALTYDPYLVY